MNVFDESGWQIAPGEGVGPVRLGMTEVALRAIEEAWISRSDYASTVLELPHIGMLVWLDEATQAVTQILLDSRFRGSFRGVRVGDKVSVLRSLGTIAEEPWEEMSLEPLYILEIPGIGFGFDEPDDGSADDPGLTPRAMTEAHVITDIVVLDTSESASRPI